LCYDFLSELVNQYSSEEWTSNFNMSNRVEITSFPTNCGKISHVEWIYK
jgi:hypothetical protein